MALPGISYIPTFLPGAVIKPCLFLQPGQRVLARLLRTWVLDCLRRRVAQPCRLQVRLQVKRLLRELPLLQARRLLVSLGLQFPLLRHLQARLRLRHRRNRLPRGLFGAPGRRL